jgi:hypothetical protein
MFPQLGSPLIAVTPVIGIVHSDRHRTPVFVLLCTPVQLDCSLVALQASFDNPFLEPQTHSCENILLSFELYEIEISVAASMPAH